MWFELLKGCISVIGGFLGIVVIIFVILKIPKSGGNKNKAIVKAFKKYKEKIIEKEKYEQVQEIDDVISKLKEGAKSSNIKGFNIKEEPSFKMKKNNLKVTTKYKITKSKQK